MAARTPVIDHATNRPLSLISETSVEGGDGSKGAPDAAGGVLAIVLGLSSIAVGAVWGTVHTVMERRSRAQLEEAKQDMSARAIRPGAKSIGRARGQAAGLGRSPLSPGRLRASPQPAGRGARGIRASSARLAVVGLERRAAIAAGDGSRPVYRVREIAEARLLGCPDRTSPRLAGAWCSCSAWRDDSRKPDAGSKTASTR